MTRLSGLAVPRGPPQVRRKQSLTYRPQRRAGVSGQRPQLGRRVGQGRRSGGLPSPPT